MSAFKESDGNDLRLFLNLPINSTAKRELSAALPPLPHQKIVFSFLNALTKDVELFEKISPFLLIRECSKVFSVTIFVLNNLTEFI